MSRFLFVATLLCIQVLLSSNLFGQSSQLQKITAAVPEKPLVKPKKQRHLLVYSKAWGFKHKSIGLGKELLQALSEKTAAFKVTFSDDLNEFNADNLKKYDAVFFNNTSKIEKGIVDPKMRKGLIDYVKNGGGLIGIHAASDGGWPEYTDMLGGYFDGHTWNNEGTWGVVVEDYKHPVAAPFPNNTFTINDELYKYKDFDRTKVRVLMSIDLEVSPKNGRADKDNPLAWLRSYGKGRVFYSGFGHNPHVYWNKSIIGHWLAGIQFALGDLDCETKPQPKPELVSQVTPYLSPEEALKTIKLQDGYYLEAVVTDPIIKEPSVAAFDGNGRLYVVEMRTYMQNVYGKGQYEKTSRVSRHEDTNGDGEFDKHTVFADNLLLPRMVLPLDNRVIIGETNTLDLYCYEDTTGDGVADKKSLWYKGGRRGGNLEHQPSGLIWSMDNWLYTTYTGARLRFTNGKIEQERIPANSGQWGLTQDNDGKVWFVNAGGEQGPSHFQQHIQYCRFYNRKEMKGNFRAVWPLANIPEVQGGPRRLRSDNTLNHFTATCGQSIFRGDRLPAELRGNLFFAEPVGQLIRRTEIEKKDGVTYLSHPYEKQKSEFIRSTDTNFRPVNMVTGPDGCLYIVDMYRGIVQEGQWTGEGTYLHRVIKRYKLDENFGRGRIWRLRHKDFERGKEPKMLSETPAQLVKHLSHPNGWWRDTAQKLIILKGDKSVVPALRQLAKKGKSTEARLHALWTMEGLGSLSLKEVSKALQDSDPRLRSSAIRLAESLYKNGDKQVVSLLNSVAADKDAAVLSQYILTAKYLDIPNWEDKALAISEKSKFPVLESIYNKLLHKKAKKGSSRKFSKTETKLMAKGKLIYNQLCSECHGKNARGNKSGSIKLAPALVNTARVLGSKDAVANILLFGMTGKIDGHEYPGNIMIPMGSNGDEWVASVLSYVRTNFGNNSSTISSKEVNAIRKAAKGRKTPWKFSELTATHATAMLKRKDWKLTASEKSKSAKNAVNGNLKSRYDTGKKQAPGMWLQIELPQVKVLQGLVLDANVSAADYPRAYKVQLSLDGKRWSKPFAEGQGKGSLTDIKFNRPAKAKFVRITLTKADKSSYWSIHDLYLIGK